MASPASPPPQQPLMYRAGAVTWAVTMVTQLVGFCAPAWLYSNNSDPAFHYGLWVVCVDGRGCVSVDIYSSQCLSHLKSLYSFLDFFNHLLFLFFFFFLCVGRLCVKSRVCASLSISSSRCLRQNLAFRMHAHPLALKNGLKHEFFLDGMS